MATKSIGIDIREVSEKHAGKSRYCEEIAKAMIKSAPKDTQFFLFTKKKTKALPGSNQIQIPGRGIIWHFNLRRHLKKNPVDFFLSPTSYIYPSIAPRSQKLAIVIHDLIAFLHPKNNHWLPTIIEKFTLKKAIKNSDFLITVSENTKKDLFKFKRFAACAKDKNIIIAGPAASPEMKRTASHKLNLPKNFLLAVGTLQPRKNFKAIFQAFSGLAKENPDLHLCVVGGKGWKISKIFKAIPQEFTKRIHFLGYMPYSDLPELYSRAKMLVFPSLYEGFGIPPLEAMSCGCPVVTSSTSSLPEVVGDAALQIPPENADALTQAIASMLIPEKAENYAKRGLTQAKKFSWEKSSEAILAAID